MKAVLINYNYVPNWLLDTDLDYLIYDRSDDIHTLDGFDQSRIIHTDNVGQVDYDKLSYLVDNYDHLPDVFLWGKTNLFKYITPEEWEKVANNKEFTPLLTQHHKTYSDQLGPVCYYQDGMYYERNDSWYVHQFNAKYCRGYSDFAQMFMLPNPPFLPFAPGGNYILTKETVHKYSRDYYDSMRSVLPYCIEPAEAQMAERSYYTMWR